jgi:hypothetical protein
LPNLLTATLGAPASALGLIEGLSDGLAGAARLAGGAIADDPRRRRAQAVAGYTTTAVLSSLIGAATAVWQVGILRAGAWAARGLRVPARNACWPTSCRPPCTGGPTGWSGRTSYFTRASAHDSGDPANPCSLSRCLLLVSHPCRWF